MAQELDLQAEWQRLFERYREMSDGELLELAGGIDDLTEVAGDVLRRELKSRALVQPVVVEETAPVPEATVGSAMLEEAGARALNTFYDAFDAGRACEYLEAEGIPFEVRDISEPRSGFRTFDGSPPVVLQLFVEHADRQRAIAVLRSRMGLFPLQEVAVADEAEDDGTISRLGNFARREDAEALALILEEAGLWHRIVANPEGTMENEDCYDLEVREIDLMKAGEVIESGTESPED